MFSLTGSSDGSTSGKVSSSVSSMMERTGRMASVLKGMVLSSSSQAEMDRAAGKGGGMADETKREREETGAEEEQLTEEEKRARVQQFLPKHLFSNRFDHRFFTASVAGWDVERKPEDAAFPAIPKSARCCFGVRENFALYDVVCESGGSSWCVRRRYSDFAKLAKAIRAASREDPEFAKALQEGSTRPAKESVKKVLQWLPPKTVAPCVKEAFLTKRQEALAKFTEEALSLPAVMKLGEVRSFLDLPPVHVEDASK